MKSNWDRVGIPLMQWLAVPLSVFAFCYFVVGPFFGGPSEKPKKYTSAETVETNQQPIQPGKRKWTPVSPPQVSINVTRQPVENTDNPGDIAPPLDETPPDNSSGDEGSSSGVTAPPVKVGGGGEGQTQQDPAKQEENKNAFKGVGH